MAATAATTADFFDIVSTKRRSCSIFEYSDVRCDEKMEVRRLAIALKSSEVAKRTFSFVGGGAIERETSKKRRRARGGRRPDTRREVATFAGLAELVAVATLAHALRWRVDHGARPLPSSNSSAASAASLALRRCNVPHALVCAYDVDDSALRVYRHNSPAAPLSGADIVSLSDAELARGGGGRRLLSPPCQPYSRQGLQLGARDGRSAALLHLLDVLERADAAALPAFLLLENVAGFESSETRRRLHAVLAARGLATREVWASPSPGVPSQRTRYFMLARRLGAFAAAPPEIERLLSTRRRCRPRARAAARAAADGQAEDAGACAPLPLWTRPGSDRRWRRWRWAPTSSSGTARRWTRRPPPPARAASPRTTRGSSRAPAPSSPRACPPAPRRRR